MGIKELAQKMREESSSKKEEIKPASSTAGLARIPKIPKKEETSKEVKDRPAKKGASFEDLMFAMDSTTKSVKAPPIKNKNKDLLESISNSMSVKPTPKSSLDGKAKSGSSKASDYLLQMRTEDKSKAIIRADSGSKITKVEEKKPTQDKNTEVKKGEEKKVQDKKSETTFLNEKKEDKKKEETKKKEEEKKKEDEKEKKDLKISAEDDSGNKTSPEGGNSSPQSDHSKSPSQDINDSNKDVEMPFPEPERALPREVRGILVYTKGPKRTRRIQWRSDDSLVETQYFELDETERVNVNKLKFEEQRKRELELEKTALHKKPSNNEINDDRQWPTFTNLALSCELPEIDYGGNSNEKKEQ